mmetsp:Transcript_37974/g.92053  ORF Transcript_37974/g.92053 Transcript_37974/m.92053 type:complete len:363 (-) Transcript_37974:1173-2261(-)
MLLFGNMFSSSKKSTMRREFDLLQAAISEVMEKARLHPDLNANELTLLTLSSPDRNQMTIVQAISSLRRASSDQVKEPPNKASSSLNVLASHAPPNLVVVAPIRASPSAIEGWDLIDNSSGSAATARMQVDGTKQELKPKPPVSSSPTAENDIIMTDLAENETNEQPGQKVQTLMSQEESSSARSHIHRCVILGTLVSMLIEMMKLQTKNPDDHQDPYEIATRIYEKCSNDNDASILYEAALAIALLVPFTPAVVVPMSTTSSRSDNESSSSSKKEGSDGPTFLGHKVGADHHLLPEAFDVVIPNAKRIEFLVLEPEKNGWDRLYIGSVMNNLPQGVGCSVYAKKDKLSASSDNTRTTCGTW